MRTSARFTTAVLGATVLSALAPGTALADTTDEGSSVIGSAEIFSWLIDFLASAFGLS
ncbi:hypothetical protein [Rhodococcus rhodochrous]|uniref:hypothetical protein n=1 Tax=Rhodococcus rhodochrous TaxID=1829 RepID=UPI000AEDB6E7|nr:hypothetical protein [Rhodococcus rhodochrous]